MGIPCRTRHAALAAAMAATALGVPASAHAAAPKAGKAPEPQAPSAEVRGMLSQVSPRRIERDIRTLASFGNRNTLSDQSNPRFGIGAARNWLKAQMDRYATASGGRLQVQLQSFIQPPADRIPSPTTITNVVATLPGTQAASHGRTYVISGHYDSRATDALDPISYAPGADDDASGVATVLELARVMSKHRFDATLVFMAVAGEEQGLYGSTYAAQRFKAAGADVQGMLDNDIVGSSLGANGLRRPHQIRLFAEGVPTAETEEQAAVRRSVGGENDSPARQLARFVLDVAANKATGMKVNVIYRRDRYLRGGDHIPFLEQGYPAVRFTEPNENYDHQHQDVRKEDGKQIGDLPRFVDFPFTARVARVNLATLAGLASAPSTPRGFTIDTSRLAVTTTLSWKANGEPDLDHYELLWRPTTALTWTHVRSLGERTRITVPQSKDNYFFGLRAVDRAGHRSPAAFPAPSD
jgi:Peptidase family M28